ncbi:MAG: YkgJ family cysteine cluster protein [Proteobacteria bacterium]|nr:YkgJ family cysteine cluster protein [Pseudomonadota bacterium]
MPIPFYITTWAWTAMYRRLKWFLFRREPEVVGECRQCGCCCRAIVLRVGGKWLRSRRVFERARAKDSEMERFVIEEKDDDGRLVFSCTLLTDQGLCGDYANRLDLCQRHPALSLYYSGVVLADYCGFKLKGPGFRDVFAKLRPTNTSEPFASVLEKERTRTMHQKRNDES